MHKVSNQEIAKTFQLMAEYLDMADVPFKPRAFERVARSIDAMEDEVYELYEKQGIKGLENIPGVGKGIAERIEELLKTGKVKDLEKLKKKTPVDLASLTAIEGLGPKMVKALWQKLKIKTVQDLEKAAKAGKIAKLPRFGEKSEQKVLKGIEFLKKSGGRFLLGDILPLVRSIEHQLKKLKPVEEVMVAGSVRRWQETIGDVDLLVISENPEPVMEFFVSMPEVIHIYGKGETKAMVRLKNQLDVDLRVIPKESFGGALQYFTGSKDHNVAVRQIAIKKGYKLNEYGLFKGKKRIAGEDEKEIYNALGLEWMPPEMRHNTGEIEAAREGKLPHLIGWKDLRGDLQIQTNWTDGANSIEEMAKEAMRLGMEYICITDHTKSLAMTGGADEKQLERQGREIDKLNEKFKSFKFKVLKGAEVNIMKDGSLDIADSALAKLDVVGAAIHSHFTLSPEEQTRRLSRAMENPHVDIIFHPTGRIINKRDSIQLDMDDIIKTAKRTGTVLEIDAYPDRLDLKDEYIRRVVAAGVKLSIDSDAHAVTQIHYLELGIAQARRGWAEKKDIINAWPLDKMRNMLK